MMTAYGLGYLAGMSDQRKANTTLHQSSFADQARRDFAAYAKMDERQLQLALRSHRLAMPGPAGEKREAVLQFIAEYRAQWCGRLPAPREIMANVPDVSRKYVGELLREARA